MKYRHLDSHISISKENYPAFANALNGDPQGFANARGWQLDIISYAAPHVLYISLPHPIDAIDAPFIDILARYVRPGDWIALQPGNDKPVMCTVIEFDGNGNWTTRKLTWNDFCAEHAAH